MDEKISSTETNRNSTDDEKERLCHRLTRLEALVKVSALINSTLDLDKLLEIIIGAAEDVMEAEASSLMLVNDENSTELVFQIATGVAGQAIKEERKTLEIGQGIAGWVAKTGEPELIEDAYDDPRFFPEYDKITGFRTKSILCVPLVVQDNIIGVAQVFNRKDGKAFNQDDLELFSHFCVQTSIAIDNARLHSSELVNERIKKDLQTARIIQQSFLPDVLPEVENFHLEAVNYPAMSVGGDLYDAFPLNDNHLGVFVGDVSGKGVTAALFMARLLSDFRFESKKFPTPIALLSEINRLLCERSSMGMFVTVMYVHINPKTKEISIGNAGHPPALLLTQEGTVKKLSPQQGVPLGIMPKMPYSQLEYTLKPGERMLLYTDGIVEARNEEGEMYGIERLISSFENNRDRKHIAEAIVKDVKAFNGDAPQHDDITMLSITVEK